jgi:hypothetical protein
MLPSDTIEGKIQDAIREQVYSQPDLRAGPYSLRFSSAGDCPRLLDYKLKYGRKELDVKSAARILTGEPIHEYYRRILKQSFGEDYTNIEGEVFLDVAGERILGHCDGFFKSLNAVVEIKTVGSYVYEKVRSSGEPLPAHYAQANAYAAALGAEQIAFIYHDRDSGDHLLYLVPFIPELWDKVVAKFTDALARKASGELHPRPYLDATNSPCSFCDYRTECYESFSKEIGELGEKEPSDSTKLSAVKFLEQRAVRLVQERVEEELRSIMIKAMVQEGVKRVATHMGEVSLTAGKNNNILVKIKETK